LNYVRRNAMKRALILALTLVFATMVFTMMGTTFAESQENEFVIFHYWTAGGEKEAIDAIFEIYQREHPGVKIVENPVAGGGGDQ